MSIENDPPMNIPWSNSVAIAEQLPSAREKVRPKRASWKNILAEDDRSSVGSLPTDGNIYVAGKITLYRGVPEIALHNAKDWSLQKSQP
jgi:hypothetical protein